MRAKAFKGFTAVLFVFVIVLLVAVEKGYAPPPGDKARKPVAVLTPDRGYQRVGFDFIFDGTESHDRDDLGEEPQIVKYEWIFDYDGPQFNNPDVTEDLENPGPDGIAGQVSHSYSAPGDYTVALRVTDNETNPAGTDIKEITVYVRVPRSVPSQWPTIQAAIDAAGDYEVIVVEEGTYVEDFVDFNGKKITVTSTDPYDWDVVENTVIEGGVVFHSLETFDSVIKGITISGGSPIGTGISINGHDDYAYPIISNCIIENCNRGIACYGYNAPHIQNCKIRYNGKGILSDIGTTVYWAVSCYIYNNGQGIAFQNDQSFGGGVIANNTIVGNTSYGANIAHAWVVFENNILWDNADDIKTTDGQLTPEYCCIKDGDDVGINGNIDEDPLFVDAANHDYHLQSISPCIDAGWEWFTRSGVYEHTDIDSESRFIDGDNDGEVDVDMGADEAVGDIIVCLAFTDETHLDGDSYYHYPSLYYEDLQGYIDLLDTLELEVHSRCIVPGWGIGWVLPQDVGPPEEISVEICSRPPTFAELMAHFDEVRCGGQPTRIYLCVDISGSMTCDPVALQGGYEQFVAELRATYGEETVVEYPFGNPLVPNHRWILAMTKTIGYGDIPVYNVTKDEYYFTIQAAIDDADDDNDNTIVAAPGTYYESIDFLGKSITVQGLGPSSWSFVEDTVIDADGAERVVEFNEGEGAGSKLFGFTITGASSAAGSGAVYCNSSSPSIRHCRIVDNSGRGVFCGGSNGSPEISNCIISGNGNLSEIYGGGIFCGYSSSPTIINSLISDNEGVYGGGIGCGYYGNPYIRNCTITENVASVVGGGLYIDMGAPTPGQPEIINSIIYGNSAYILFGSIAGNTSTISYSLVWGCGGSADWDSTFGIDGGGNIDGYPLFEPDDALYHLQFSSPCRDKGNSSYVETGEVDIDSQPRRHMLGTVDMGSDEYGSY